MSKEQDKSYLSGGEQEAGVRPVSVPAGRPFRLTRQPQPVFDREAALEDQLAAEREARAERERQLEEAQAELERQRALRRDRKKRWEERHPEEARRKHAEYERARYARRRQQATGSSDSELGGRSPAP